MFLPLLDFSKVSRLTLSTLFAKRSILRMCVYVCGSHTLECQFGVMLRMANLILH